MKLALRTTYADSANWAERRFADLTRWRLCSQWCHGGIVVGDHMLHANARHGLHCSDYTPSRWTLIDLGSERDTQTLALFKQRKGAGYDFAGVLGFAFPGMRGRDDRLYCFEWCALAMGLAHHRWMTPERLLGHALMREVAATA